MKKLQVKDLKKILDKVDDDTYIVCAGEERDYFPAFIYQECDELYFDYRPPEEDCLCCENLLSCENDDDCCLSCDDFKETRKIFYEE